MGQRDYTNYQKKIISRYYQSLDKTSLQRLQELVTELYLADTDKRKQRLWEQVEKAMKNLAVQPAIAEHILNTRDVRVLAKNLQDWLKRN